MTIAAYYWCVRSGAFGDIEHRFCEPDKKERSKIGSKNFSEIALELAMAERLSDDELAIKARAIEIARYFPVRESFWLDQIKRV